MARLMVDARRRAVMVALGVKWLAIAAGLMAPMATIGVQRIGLFVVAVIGAALRVDDNQQRLTVAGIVILAATAAASAAAAVPGALIGVGVGGGAQSFAFAAVFLIAADAAVQRGGGLGALVGAAGSGVVVLLIALEPGPLVLSPAELYAYGLTPMAGLAFGTIHRDLPFTGVRALRATTHALDELVALSQRLQPGLDRWAVAEAVVAGLRDSASVDGGRAHTNGPHLLISMDGVLHGVGAPWHRRPLGLMADLPRSRRTRPFRTVTRDALPPAVAQEVTSDRWLLHRIDETSGGGAVLVDGHTHPVVLDRIIETASTATIALANAARFEELQAIATDAARSRLAADLHDGIAQALTHARFELELLSMQQADEGGEELQRARSAADAALAEVRRTIGELRDEMPLSEALRHHVETVRSFARVPVELRIEGEHEPEEDTGREVLRLAQEALSNALRHSGCSRVEIEMHLDRDGLLLLVADDGAGIGPDVQAGVGLSSMRDRAEAVGGDLRIGPGVESGTEVELEVSQAFVATDGVDGDDGADGDEGDEGDRRRRGRWLRPLTRQRRS